MRAVMIPSRNIIWNGFFTQTIHEEKNIMKKNYDDETLETKNMIQNIEM